MLRLELIRQFAAPRRGFSEPMAPADPMCNFLNLDMPNKSFVRKEDMGISDENGGYEAGPQLSQKGVCLWESASQGDCVR